MESLTFLSPVLGVLSTATYLWSTLAYDSRTDFSSEYWSSEYVQSRDRIVGGVNATEVFPYMVSLKYNNRHDCGGVIVTAVNVLTAAHCTTNKLLAFWTAWVGSMNVKEGARHRVVQFLRHPAFDNDSLNNDIAILTVVPPFDFTSPFVKPIRLSSQYLGPGVLILGMGWGRTVHMPATRPTTLQLLYQTTITNQECSLKWRFPIVESQFCSTNTSRTCLGDSGGPIVTVQTKSPELVGLVSYGPDGCNADVPNVRTRLSSFTRFIGSAIRGTTPP